MCALLLVASLIPRVTAISRPLLVAQQAGQCCTSEVLQAGACRSWSRDSVRLRDARLQPRRAPGAAACTGRPSALCEQRRTVQPLPIMLLALQMQLTMLLNPPLPSLPLPLPPPTLLP